MAELGRTLVDVLERRAAEHPERLAFRFLLEGTADGRAEEWSYRHLATRARAVAAELHARGLAGQPVLLLYPSGLEFVAAFFGCLYARAIAVPAYPPDPSRLGRTLPRLQSIAADVRAGAVLTTEEIAALSRALASFAPDLTRLPWLATDPLRDGDPWRRPDGLTPETTAFLQYTSGSTSAPKGVIVSHANLRHNQLVLCEGFGHHESPAPLGWLPLFHDMGLIGHVAYPVWQGGTSTLLSPQDFLRRPVEWLRAASRFRATHSGGPDFGFALCARKATDEEIAALDLSAWASAYCGAERVRASTMRRFAERLAPARFSPRSLVPCYGLAESTLMATCSAPDAGAHSVPVDAKALAEGRLEPQAGSAAEMVSVGGPLQGTELCLVDPESRAPVPDGRVGEVWLRGGSVAGGYWNQPEATRETFAARTAGGEGPFLRTGDLGVRSGGQLYLTGRLKDVLIVRGRNLYPDDLEEAVEASHPAIRPGCAVVFPVDEAGEEQVAVACEVDEGTDLQAVAEAVRGAIAAAADAEVHAVSLVPRRALPKTSSGKKQRRATREAFLSGELEERARITFADRPPVAPDEPAPATLEAMETWLARQVAWVLGCSPDRIRREATFESQGLDSVRAVELAARLDQRLDRPLHPTILYNIPSVARLAAWLVQGGPSAATTQGDGRPLYLDLPAALERLDRRNPESYRFDLERDVPWERAGEPGLYFPPELFRTLGLTVEPLLADPEAWRLLQAASAMTTLTAFEVVEVTITLFIDTRWPLLGETASIHRFREEESKHIRLFRRYGQALKAMHPELLVELDWDPSWGVGFWELFRNPQLFPDERVFHYLFWFFFVAFEEHSIYLADVLGRATGIQPAWLAAHQCHRREEIQHIATDHAYAGALDLEGRERDRWSEVCVAWLCQHFDTFFAFGSARRLVARRFPHLAGSLRTQGFVRSPFLQELLHAPSFRRTRLSCPYLRELETLDPSHWPTDEALARRLPAEWMQRGAAVLPDPVGA